MLILALDLARVTGWAIGRAGAIPLSGSWVLRKPNEAHTTEAQAIVANLQHLAREHGLPDIVCCEAFMNPAAQPNAASVVTQIYIHGVVSGWCALRGGIRCVTVSPTTARDVVCLKGRAAPLSAWEKANKTANQVKEAQRKATKSMVINSVHLLGLMPKDCFDDNRADACVAFRWCEDVMANVRGAFALQP